jgi:Pectate lyase superfamily protein
MKNRLLFSFLILYLFPLLANGQSAEFYGPLSSWTNLKQAYHAAGDGVQDDTKAIQMALDELSDGKHSSVLYIPKGTYRITATLTMNSVNGIAIIGEDPLTTIIKWDGPSDGKMLLLNGVSYSEYGRLTWDGNNTAAVAVAHEWDRKVKYANSGTAHYDEIFKNVGAGLKSGNNMDAEFSIRRCRFYNCSAAGISLQGWNALDWWVWDCYFEKCYTGLANNLPQQGAGNFHVYRSIFKYSTLADISLGNSNYFSFRNNISYNSNAFIVARQFSNTSPITLQNNLIINTKNVLMAYLFTKGNVLFLDNTFVSPDDEQNYIIQQEDNWDGSPSDLTMIGNQFTATKQVIQTDDDDRVINIDSKYGIKMPPLPSLDPKPFAAAVKYPVYEITNTMATNEIQAIINSAAIKNKKAIIHFKYGNYVITQSLQIPAGAPLIFCGDGLQSALNWRDTANKPVIQIAYPAKCIVQNIKIFGANKADGILLYDNDKPGNSIYADQLLVFHGVKTNIFINGFENTDFRFEDLQHNYCSKGTSIEMIGRSKPAATILKIFGGESAGNNNSYSVDKNGRILVYDTWYEDGGTAQFLSLKNSGEFILNGGKIANTNAVKAPFITVDSFNGKFVLAQVIFNNAHNKTIHFVNTTGNAKFLSLGNLSWDDSTAGMYDMDASKQSYALINNRYNVGKGSFPISNDGQAANAIFLKDMLSTIRSTSVLPNSLNSNSAHLTMNRVMIENGVNDVRVERSK